MSRPAAVEPYLRGCAYPATDGVPYPRADRADDRLPVDTRRAAESPSGVRLELTGDARRVEVDWTNGVRGTGRGAGGASAFALWRGGRLVAEADASGPGGTVSLAMGAGDPHDVAIVYLPEALRPLVLEVRAVDGAIAPAPPVPRWLCYGDSITERWSASMPSSAWPAVVARDARVDTVNLGYAGAARGELASAEQLAALDAHGLVLAFGTNCWSRVAHDAALLAQVTRAFLATVRRGHPGAPVVVVSPIVRPDAELVPNAAGATLGALRTAMEDVVDEIVALGDGRLTLVRGASLVPPELLVDGVHPGDEGHARIAAAVTDAMRAVDPAG